MLAQLNLKGLTFHELPAEDEQRGGLLLDSPNGWGHRTTRKRDEMAYEKGQHEVLLQHGWEVGKGT